MSPYAEHNAAAKVALPDPDMQIVIGGQTIKIHSIEAIHAHAAAVSANKDAEIATLREDAFLYRWLREQHESSDSGETMRVFRPDVGRGCLMPVSIEPGQLDAAIAAARKGAA